MYDWANSAFYTTVVGTLFSPYITRLAQSAVGENGVVLDLGPLGAVTAKSLPTLCVSISVGAQVFLLPVLGAIGDYSNLKKRLMAVFCYIAVVANCLMFFVADGLYLSITCSESFAHMELAAVIVAARATRFGAYRLERKAEAWGLWPAAAPKARPSMLSTVAVLFIAG